MYTRVDEGWAKKNVEVFFFVGLGCKKNGFSGDLYEHKAHKKSYLKENSRNCSRYRQLLQARGRSVEYQTEQTERASG